jgi:hypothetical protein
VKRLIESLPVDMRNKFIAESASSSIRLWFPTLLRPPSPTYVADSASYAIAAHLDGPSIMEILNFGHIQRDILR